VPYDVYPTTLLIRHVIIGENILLKKFVRRAVCVESISLKTDLFCGYYGELMKSYERKNSENSINESIHRAHFRQLDIHGLKHWAKENLPRTSQIRSILLLERDYLAVEEFIAKMDLWLKLIDLENNIVQ
jgi:hypothetical protein